MKKIKPNYTLREVLVKTLGDDEVNLLDVQSFSDILTIKEYIPEELYIDNREEIYNNLRKGDKVTMLLSDDAGNTDEVLSEKIEEGEIVVTSSDPESVEVETPKTLISAGTGETVTITIDWDKYNLHTSIEVVAGPLPTSLDISNRDEVTSKILEGESVVMQLLDDIGTTQEQFRELVESGEIVVTSSDPDIVAVEGLTLTPSTSPSVPTSLKITNPETFYPVTNAANEKDYAIYENGYDYSYSVIPGRAVELLFSDDIGTTQEQFRELVESGEIILEIEEDTLGVYYLENNFIYSNSTPTIRDFGNYLKIKATWTAYNLTAEKTYEVAPPTISITPTTETLLEVGETLSLQFYVSSSTETISGLKVKQAIDEGLYVENSLLQYAFNREYTEDGVTLTAVKGIYNSEAGVGVKASSQQVAYNCLAVANTPILRSRAYMHVSVNDTTLTPKEYKLPIRLFSSDRWMGYSNAMDYAFIFDGKPYPMNPRPLENGGQVRGSLGIVLDKDNLNSELLEQFEKGITTNLDLFTLTNGDGVTMYMRNYLDYYEDDMDAVEELFKNEGINIIPESIVTAWWSSNGTIDNSSYEYIPFTSTIVSSGEEYIVLNGDLYNVIFDPIVVKNEYTFTAYALTDELIDIEVNGAELPDNLVVDATKLKNIPLSGYPQSTDTEVASQNNLLMLRTFRYNLNTYFQTPYEAGQKVTIKYDDILDAQARGEYYYLQIMSPITYGLELDLYFIFEDTNDLSAASNKRPKVYIETNKDRLTRHKGIRGRGNGN